MSEYIKEHFKLHLVCETWRWSAWAMLMSANNWFFTSLMSPEERALAREFNADEFALRHKPVMHSIEAMAREEKLDIGATRPVYINFLPISSIRLIFARLTSKNCPFIMSAAAYSDLRPLFTSLLIIAAMAASPRAPSSAARGGTIYRRRALSIKAYRGEVIALRPGNGIEHLVGAAFL